MARGLETLMDGIKSNDMAAMVQVVEGGASCYAEVLDGNVTLNLAAYALFGHVAAIEWMVEKGADVTAANTGGCTALHFAAMSGHVTAMHCLVEHGADVKAANKDGATALHHAAHFAVQDTEWKALVTPLPQMLSACTPVTEGMVHGSGSHVTAPDVLSEHAASRHCASLTLAVLRALLP